MQVQSHEAGGRRAVRERRSIGQGFTAPRSRSSAATDEFVIRARVAKPGTDANDTQATVAARSQQRARRGARARGATRCVRTEAVGPKVGGELRQKAFIAILLSFFAVLAYLAFRFEWRFGLAAVIATAHDILATFAFIGSCGSR